MAGWLHGVACVNADSFLHNVASPFHPFVNTRRAAHPWPVPHCTAKPGVMPDINMVSAPGVACTGLLRVTLHSHS